MVREMGLFSRPEPTIRPKRTLGGAAQREPEDYGTWARRERLYTHVTRVLASHPLASQHGAILGDGTGMEELVEVVTPIFKGEEALIRWTALRGALPALWSCGPPVWDEVAAAVGLEWMEQGPSGSGEWGPNAANQMLPASAIQAGIGLQASVMMKVANYDEIKTWDADRLISDPSTYLNTIMGLECIAWVAVAMHRVDRKGLLPPLVVDPPQPSALEGAGWYVDPLFAKADRYYDGTGWTPRCRARPGTGRQEWTQPL